MTVRERIAAYQALLEGINAAMDRVDAQMSTLQAEYENLKKLNQAVTADIQAFAATFGETSIQS